MEQGVASIDQHAEDIVREIGIPPCPAILTTIVAEMRADEPDFPKIGNLISRDVGLAASMLKTVNSPFYGLTSKATTVQKALALLGLRNVAQLTTALLLRQAFPVDQNSLLDGFWKTSTRIATVAAHLARQVKGIDRDEAYTFALFRDCGVPVLMEAFADYPVVYRDACRAQDRTTVELEDEEIGIDHARVGQRLAASWHLPEHTCLAIRHHHDAAALTDGSGAVNIMSRRLIAIATIAEHLSRLNDGTAPLPDWGRFGAVALDCCNLEADDLPGIVKEIRELIAKE